MRRLSWNSPVVAMCVLILFLGPVQAFSIVNGTLDLTTECVGSLHEIYALGFVCTGTLIHESWVLTAAQCAVLKPNVWAMGPDWSSGPRAYWADYVVIHPAYSAPGIFDIALVHLAVPVPLEPVCSPLSPAEDTLSVGVTINHVGYGLTGYPDGFTSQRHRVSNTVASLDPVTIWFEASSGGPCHGDIGGPALTTNGKVGGVISGFAETCDGVAADTRVSSSYESFIIDTILSPPGLFFDGFESGDTSAWVLVAQ